MKVECKECQLIKLLTDELKRKNKIINKLREEKQVKIKFSSN